MQSENCFCLSGGRSEGRVFLSMRDPIQVVVMPENFEFQYGNSFSVSCVVGGTPLPKLSWKKDGQIIEVTPISSTFIICIKWFRPEY